MKYKKFFRSASVSALLCLSSFVYVHNVEAKCEGTPFNPVTEVAWNGIFPIRVGGVVVAQNASMPDGASGTVDPICTCTDSQSTYIGTEISFWDIGYVAEVVHDAYCSPTLGMSFSGLDNGFHSGTNSQHIDSPHTFKQIHWYKFPVFHMLAMLADLKCLQSGNDVVPGDMSEIMPDYSDDYMAAWKDPKVFLFANPVADIACIGKNAIAQVPGGYFPVAYDSLFWCQWDNIYPLSGNVASPAHLTSAAQIVSRQIYTYTQLGSILDYTRNSCAGQAVPLMKSSQWRYQLAKPVKSATPIWAGQSELTWGSGKAEPFHDSNFLFVLFQKKKCCQKLKGAN